jgi:hypothetical protein
METVSEKPRRGRPKIYSDDAIQRYKALWSDRITSGRGLQNIARMQHAIRVLTVSGLDFHWLYNPRTVKQAILYDLGRLSTDAEITDWAAFLCERKPTGKAAVAMLRNYRLGGSSKQGAIGLGAIIATTIDDFVRRYPNTTRQQVLTALENVSDVVRESRQDDE